MADGVGFTVMVAVIGVPGQLLAVGVIVMVAVTGVVPLFVAAKEAMSPEPEAARPMEVSLLVHEKVVPFTALVNAIAVEAAPLQTAWIDGVATAFGVGLTVMVAVIGVPGQLLATGVTVMTAVTGAVPLLTAEKEAMSPVPEAARPIVVLLLVQLKVVPLTVPVKAIAVVDPPLQTTCVDGAAVAVGVGFTVIVAVTGAPKQPLANGVTVMVDVTGVVPALTAVNDGILPDPEAPRPMVELLLVQVKVVPLTGLVNTIAVEDPLLQTVWAAGVATAVGVGLTVMVAVID
jgi:hypothetical protein